MKSRIFLINLNNIRRGLNQAQQVGYITSETADQTANLNPHY